MATASKYDTLAQEILRGVGGEGNVASVTHCATRLRFQIKDRDQVDKTAVENTKGVITVVEAGGQFQVVIGSTVANVYQAVVDSTSISPAAEGAAASGGVMARAIDLITSIFTPFLWVLAGSGLLKALLAVAVKIWPDWAASGAYAILFSAGDAVFQFLPILLAITAAKKFKANTYVAVGIAAALIYSATIAVIPGADGATLTLSNFAASGGQLTFFGIPVTMISYLSAVIPTLLAIFAQSRLERLLDRVLPEALRNFLNPMLTLTIIVPLTFLAIGPVANMAGSALSGAVNWVWSLSPAVGGAIMGGFWQVFVIFGLHWGFVPVMIQDLSVQGYSILTGPLFAAVLAQGAATLAVFFKTRNKELKEVAGPAAVSGILAGITEPAIYGVTLRLKKPFVYGVIGGVVGGAIAAIGGSAAEGFVLPGAITLAATMNIGSFTMQLIGTGLAMAIAFGLTMTLGFTDLPAKDQANAEPNTDDQPADDEPVVALPDTDLAAPAAGAVATLTKVLAVNAPVEGTVLALTDVADPLFSTEALGKGAAVAPANGLVVAPVTGQLVSVMPHAFGIATDDGLEVLVHIGIDTVNLDGNGFTARANQGDHVEAGQTIAQVDIPALVAAGYDPTVMVIITNTADYQAVTPATTGQVTPADNLVSVTA